MEVEKIKAVNLFEKDIEELYSQKVDSINEVVNCQRITHDLTPDGLQKLKDIVFARLWNWSDISIDRSQIKKDSREIWLSPDDALEVLFPGRNSIEYTFHKATLAIYQLPYSGASNAFHYSLRGNGIGFNGSSSNSTLEIYLYTNKGINEEIALELRSKRDKILDKIDQVLQKNRDFINSRTDDFKKLIGDSVDEIFNREKKRNDINNLL